MDGPGKRRHLVLVCNTDGALAIFRRPLIEHFVRAGWRVSTISGGNRFLDDIRRLGAEAHEIPFDRHGLSLISNLRLLLRIHRLLRSLKPDVVHCFTHKANLFGITAALACGVRGRFMTVTGLGTAFVENGLRHRLVRSIMLHAYSVLGRRCGSIFFQNPDDVRLFSEAGVLEGVNIVVTGGSGVDLSMLPVPDASARMAARSALLTRIGLEGHTGSVVLLIARTVINKGVGEFYAAARRVRTRRQDVVFIHLGDLHEGPDAVPVQEMAREGHVHYLGFDPDPRPYLIAADLVVLASYREGMPRSLLEALALDKPVVASDVPGCRETVIPGRNGLLCKVADAESLASSMLEVLDWPRDRHVGQSRQLCEARFDARILVRQTEDEYSRSLAG